MVTTFPLRTAPEATIALCRPKSIMLVLPAPPGVTTAQFNRGSTATSGFVPVPVTWAVPITVFVAKSITVARFVEALATMASPLTGFTATETGFIGDPPLVAEGDTMFVITVPVAKSTIEMLSVPLLATTAVLRKGSTATPVGALVAAPPTAIGAPTRVFVARSIRETVPDPRFATTAIPVAVFTATADGCVPPVATFVSKEGAPEGRIARLTEATGCAAAEFRTPTAKSPGFPKSAALSVTSNCEELVGVAARVFPLNSAVTDGE